MWVRVSEGHLGILKLSWWYRAWEFTLVREFAAKRCVGICGHFISGTWRKEHEGPLMLLYIHICALSAHTRVLLLFIFGWLPHRCPFRSWYRLLRHSQFQCGYTLIWLCGQIEAETLHGKGSLEEFPMVLPLWKITCCQFITTITSIWIKVVIK
jgi:hypothetical protein